jgi:hypothetical protein
LNVLSRNWANRLNLLPASREAKRRTQELEQMVENYINERIKNPEKYREERKSFVSST